MEVSIASQKYEDFERDESIYVTGRYRLWITMLPSSM
jgi:hypothetical protein